ncbi:hypothetical protein F157LOC_00422 [Pectobacterium brasiliense]|uniref:hypothetical protein n=1 Tax=Pectobacterium brasiliense TaxID=180957 RepID=UPI000CE68715|nr:hypothetical protein [Pectobacterium brasiliense]PPE61595.1 hypothetical protein F157LOC_00422 [Pectobacterium brasiliense]
MAANSFFFDNNKNLHTQEDFFHDEKENSWSSINYRPSFFGSTAKAPLILSGKVFNSVSFKDTTIENVKFINCTFNNCLFIGGFFNKCEIIECAFHGTNTHKVKIRCCLIDPKQFDKNFELKHDANIAVDLFQELYKNSKAEEQPKYANDSLYKMNVALGYNLNYKYRSQKITLLKFIYEKTKDVINRFATGYGLKIGRMFFTVIITIFFMSIVNFNFKQGFISNTNDEIKTFIDAF